MRGGALFDISVIVPAYNAGEKLGDCIRSLLESEFDGGFEVIVVDDGTTDGSLEHIRDLPVTNIRQERGGAAAARNAGARAARSDNLFFVDSDVVVLPDTLQRVYRHLQRGGVNYVGLLYSMEPRNKRWIHWYKATWNHFYDYYFPFSEVERQKGIRQAFLSGGAEAYTRQAFELLGGYDERIDGAGIEREKLFLMLKQRFPASTIISDCNIRTQHYFPDFPSILRNSFFRTSELMGLICHEGYSQPFVRRNFMRVASASFTTLSLTGAILLAIFLQSTLPLFMPLAGFLTFLALHMPMFRYTLRERGIPFTLYAVAVALIHVSSISLGSIAGFIKYRVVGL